MKKFYYNLCLTLVAAIVAVGCTEDLTTDNVVVNDATNCEMIEVVANLEIDEDTRTTLLDNNSGKVLWSEGDAIGAVLSDGTISECEATSVNGSSATFKVPSNTLYAIYPYSSKTTYNTEAGTLSHTLGSNITLDGSAKVFGDGQNVMVAQLSNSTLPFKHVCGYLEVKLKGTGTVKHVALRSNSQNWDAMSGLGTIDLSDATKPVFTASTDHGVAFNWVYATCNNVELSKSEAKSFYFVVPPRTYENLCICVQTEEGSYTISSKNSIVVNRAKIRPIAAIDIDTVKPTAATDLSAGGVANCYVVPQGSEAKYYSFPARKINGTANLEGIAYAHLSWSESATLVTNVSYDAATGTVSFKYEGNNAEGNAHIVLLNNKHEIVWYNHIWCTDQPARLAIKASNNRGYAILDRNLGATHTPATVADAANISADKATETLGLYYQYGRPSPFPRAKSSATRTESNAFKQNTNVAVQYAFAKYNQHMASTTAVHSYEAALQYPKMFYCMKYSSAAASEETYSETGSNATWYGKSVYHPFNDSDKLWHSEDADIVSKKSDNDPCPAGYCVDDQASVNAYLIGKTFTAASTNFGSYYQDPETNALIWLPYQGFRTWNSGVVNYVGNNGSSVGNYNMWAAYTVAPSNNLNCIRISGTTKPGIQEAYTQASMGAAIRCRAIDRSDLNQAEVVTKTFDGEGTEASPYLIKTADDLVKLSGLCNGTVEAEDDVDYTAAHYALAASIDMKDVEFTSITPFKGSFDGKTFSISNLTVATVGGVPTALFGEATGATIKNVTLVNCTVEVTTNDLFTAGIVGKATNSTISKCVINGGTISSTASGTFVSVCGSNGASSVIAGIAACAANTTISECSVKAKISTTGQFVGAIVGHIEGGKIDKCKVENGSDLFGKSNHTAGIAGRVTFEAEISNCTVDTPVICGYGVAGGIAGRMESGAIKNCLVTSNSSVVGHFEQDGVSYVDIGGIVGIIQTAADRGSSAVVENCACYANVEANCYIGGIVGEVIPAIAGVTVDVKNCFYKGSLTVRKSNSGGYGVAGGIVGIIGNGTVNGDANVTNCAALVSSITCVSKATYPSAGGLGGYIKKSVFNNCYTNLDAANISMVSGSGNQYGSLYGVTWWSTAPVIKNCYYLKDNRIGRDGGTAALENVSGHTIAEMTDGTLLNKLKAVGGSWTTNAEGYPVPAGAPANTGSTAAPQN